MRLATILTRPDLLWILMAMTSFFMLVLFLGFVIWMRQRREERENFYRFELRKKAIEAGVSGETLLEMQRQEQLVADRRRVEALRFGGVLATVAGLALVGLAKASGDRDVLPIAMLPVLVGIGYLVYAQVTARGIRDRGKPGD